MMSGRLHAALDTYWRTAGSMFSRTLFFAGGWGLNAAGVSERLEEWLHTHSRLAPSVPKDDIKAISPVRTIHARDPSLYPVAIRELAFTSPAVKNDIVGPILPPECITARMLHVMPVAPSTSDCPVVVHLPATGDHTYWLRFHSIAWPLAIRHGIGSVILEGPYYGQRRPPNQSGAKLTYARDLLALGATTIMESTALLQWLSEVRGHSHLALTGFSQGGLHAAMTASLIPRPIACVSVLAPHSAVPVYTPPGELSHNVAWRKLADDLPTGRGTVSQAIEYMRRLYAVTDVTAFPRPPACQRAMTLISGSDDQFVPQTGTRYWEERWPEMQSESVVAGHVSGMIRSARLQACDALVGAFERLTSEHVA